MNSDDRFISMNNQYNGINGTDLDIIFDTGNDALTQVSSNFLKYLNYYSSKNSINQSLKNVKIFSNFVNISTAGLNGGKSETIIGNLILLKFKFKDNKLNNDKIYKIFCFENPKLENIGLLIGQDTLAELFDDGYSIKWKNYAVEGKKFIKDTIKNYNELLNDAESIFKKPIQSSEFDKQKLEEVVNIIYLFITGRYLEKTNFTHDNILKIKNDIKLYFQRLDVNENKNNINRDKIYNELGIQLAINGTIKEKGTFIRSAFP
jgi:hypothetical protein